MGGRIRFFISGGASLQVHIKNLITILFSAPIIECYGSTETAGSITSTFFRDNKGGHVGGVVPCNKIQLRNTPS